MLHNDESCPIGKLAEWSIAAVLKTVEARVSGGSNPSLSASEAKSLEAKPQGFFNAHPWRACSPKGGH